MLRISSKLLIFFFLFLSFSCHEQIEHEKNSNVFDMDFFFKNQIETLSSGEFYLNKEITHNGMVENKTIQDADWNKELALFINLNLDSKKIRMDFKPDTLFQQENTFKIIYSPFDMEKELKKIEIFFNGKDVQKITIATGNENLLYSNHKLLTYSPLGYYSIEGNQHTAIGQEIKFLIKGEIITY